MNRTQALAQWRAATTLADLCELTALWLEGEIASHPGYGRPDPETTELIETLAAFNRAGFLTISSQPGLIDTSPDGQVWRQRAYVDVLVPADLRRHWGASGNIRWSGWADNDARMDPGGGPTPADRDLIKLRLIEHPTPPRRPNQEEMWWVSGRDGNGVTSAGGGVNKTILRTEILPGISKPAMAEVLSASQFTALDPVYGRNNVLWPALGRITACARRHRAAPAPCARL